jgi:hypothetical protein
MGLSQNSAGLRFLIIIHILIMVTSPWNSGDYIQQTDLVSSRGKPTTKLWDGQEDNDTIKLRAAFTNRHHEAGTIQYTPE